ncbi:hypothetical protein [Helicobacter labacensis]|nr:hypothetical protein [Helicobacter labacensis]
MVIIATIPTNLANKALGALVQNLLNQHSTPSAPVFSQKGFCACF